MRRAPTHTPTLEKLLDFVLGAGDDRRTAELAAQLEHIHTQRGDSRSGERFGELRRRFQRAAGLTDDEISAAVAAAMPQPVETLPVEEVAATATETAGEEFPVEIAAVPAELVEASPAVAEAPIAEAAPASNPAAEEVPEIEIIEDACKLEAVPAAAEPQSAATEEVDLSAEWATLLEETREPASATERPTAASPDVISPASPVADAAPPQPPAEEFPLPELIAEEPAPSAQVDEPTVHEETVAAFEEIGKPEFEVPAETADFEEWTSPLAEVSAELSASSATEEPQPAEPEIHVSEHLLPDEELTTLPVPEHSEVAAEGPETALELPQAALPEPTAPEPEFELDQDFELILEPEPVVPAYEMLSAIPPPPRTRRGRPFRGAYGAARTSRLLRPLLPTGHFIFRSVLGRPGKEIDELGLDSLTPTSSEPPVHEQLAMQSAEQQRLAQANNPITTEAGPLKEVFDEFRAELGEMGAEDEDLETHYNLGIAFREMGLLEEAIGEFQKVAKANDRGKAFRYAMQCCTLLGLAFHGEGAARHCRHLV